MRNKVYFEALDLLSHNLNLQSTYLLILHVNEGVKWPAKSDFGLSDPSSEAPTVAQNVRSKSSAIPITWGAICPIEIGRNLVELYTKIKEICHSIRILCGKNEIRACAWECGPVLLRQPWQELEIFYKYCEIRISKIGFCPIEFYRYDIWNHRLTQLKCSSFWIHRWKWSRSTRFRV